MGYLVLLLIVLVLGVLSLRGTSSSAGDRGVYLRQEDARDDDDDIDLYCDHRRSSFFTADDYDYDDDPDDYERDDDDFDDDDIDDDD